MAEHEGPPPPYIVYDIDTTIFDDKGEVVADFKDVQELWLEPPNIAVRRTRTLDDGSTIQYEDRGTVDRTLKITGKDGFGGEWSGRAFPADGTFYLEGNDGTASFKMTSWTLEQGKEERCMRVLDVHEPTAFLTEEPLPPGRYYVRTFDHVREIGTEVPDELKEPLGG